MPELKVSEAFLRQFERGLNVRSPHRSAMPVRVLGYGEISTVLEIRDENGHVFALKRMPMFKTEQEVRRYAELENESLETLREIGVRVVPSRFVSLKDEANGIYIGYIIQERLPEETIANRLIHRLPLDETLKLVKAVLRETKKVFDFNERHRGEREVGFDAQISNWAVPNYRPGQKEFDEIEPVYFDTSSPLYRKNGVEQIDPELFLRSAPSFLVWLIRLLFLKDVLTRYYDQRLVVIDFVANFYKEQRAEWIPAIVETVNEFFAREIADSRFEPISIREVKSYYREDKLIWQVYLAFRKIDRFLHRLFRKSYPYILPERIQR